MITLKIHRALAIAFVIVFQFCCGHANAQQESAKGQVEFSCVVWEQLPMSPVYYRDGESYLPLTFSLGSRSKLYPLKEAKAFELFTQESDKDGALTYKLIGKAPLVGGTRRMLYLVDSVPNAKGLPLRIFGVDDSLGTFPPGSFRFVNFTTAQLLVKFAGETNKLPAGQMKVVKSKVSPKGGFLPFLIGDAKGKVIYETRLFGQPTGRDMVFIGAPAEPGGLAKVKFLTQIIPPAPPTKPRSDSSTE